MTMIDARKTDLSGVISGGVVVIGAGAAGLTLAQAMIEHIDDVVLVEAGGLDLDGPTQNLYAGQSTNIPYYDLSSCRLRYFGGTTNHWAGYSRANDPIDYEERPEAGLPGWPVTHDELAPYIAQAAEKLGLSSAFFDPAHLLESRGISPRGLMERHSDRFETKVFQIAHNRRLGPNHLDEFRTNDRLRVILNLNATRIALSPDGRSVSHIDAITLDGQRVRLEGRLFVLCCHAIENARLMLASDDVMPMGVGNLHDHVGRYFMEHTHLFSSRLVPSPDFPKIYDFKYTIQQGINVNIGFNADTLRREEMLQYYCRFNAVYVDEEAEQSARRAYAGMMEPGDLEFLRDVADVLADARGFLGYGLTKGGMHRLPDFFEIEHRIEQAPDPESRVLLSDERDALGSRRADLQWRTNDHDVHTFRRGQEILAEEIAALGYGRLQLEPIDRAVVEAKMKGHYHHIGTTRMSARPEDGVVDRDCRVHGIENLYVGGSSVFTTAGYSGPTMMIMGLALRLGDHIRERLA